MKEKGLLFEKNVEKLVFEMNSETKKLEVECENNKDIFKALVEETKNKIIEKISLI